MPFKTLTRRFSQNNHGGVTTIMAFSAVPLILLVGASVDYTRAVTKKTALQQATDATVLAVAHYLTQNMSSSQLATNTQNYFAASADDANASITSGPTVSTDNTTVCLTAQNKVPTTIMRAASGMGFTAVTTMTVGATSCAKINNTTYEIAMVLDNSGSMLESTSGTTKIASLQTAATQMVKIMDPAGQTPKATFSLVPFSLAVNVGTQYAKASWLDQGGTSSIAFQNYLIPSGLPSTAFHPQSRFDLFNNMKKATWKGCVEERSGQYLASDTPANINIPDTLFEPYLYPDEQSSSQNTSLMRSGYTLENNYLNESNLTGPSSACSASTLYSDADKSAKTPVLNNVGNPSLPRNDTQTMVCKYVGQTPATTDYDSPGSGFTIGPNLLCDSQPLTTLTNDTTALTSQITAMYAKGSTNLFSGVMWGWRTISPNGPFNTQGGGTGTIGNQSAQPYNTKNNVKVMVLMTDGYNSWNATQSGYGNNKSTYSPFGYFENSRLGTTTSSNWRSVMDAATLQACTNVKAAGIQIYTVGFSIPSDPIDSAGLSLLQSCATKTSMAFIAQDGSSLIQTFQEIAQAMSGLRLTN